MECQHCNEPIAPGEPFREMPAITRGGAYVATLHEECFLRRIIGGLNHLLGRCTCCGGSEPPDPADVTLRAAAVEAVAYWRTLPKCDRALPGASR